MLMLALMLMLPWSWSWSWSWCWRWCWRRLEPYETSANELARHLSLLKWVLLLNRYITCIFFFSIIASIPLETTLKTVCRKLNSLYIIRRCVDPSAHRRSKPQNSGLNIMFVVRTSTTMLSHLLLTLRRCRTSKSMIINFFQKVEVIYDFDFHFGLWNGFLMLIYNRTSQLSWFYNFPRMFDLKNVISRFILHVSNLLMMRVCNENRLILLFDDKRMAWR